MKVYITCLWHDVNNVLDELESYENVKYMKRESLINGEFYIRAESNDLYFKNIVKLEDKFSTCKVRVV